MRLPVRGDALVYTVFTCALALTILMLLPGAVVTAKRDAGPSAEEITAARHRSTAEDNRTLLTASMRSYAIVAGKRDPGLNIHVFGLPGAPSLNSAVEARLLAMIEKSGGFGGRAAFSPPQTSPVHRWPTTTFAPPMAAGAEAATEPPGSRAPDPRSLNIDSSVLTAGGRFLLTTLDRRSPQPHSAVLLTDLDAETTVDARRLFTASVDPAAISADDSGALTIDGRPVRESELTPLGAQVADELHSPLRLPQPADQRSPDFSCGLLPCVALTYDDGPGDEKTEQAILDAAADADIRVTYFFLGSAVDHSPEAARKIIDAGHEVDNHTYGHPRLNRIPSEKVRKEIRRTRKSLQSVGIGAQPLLRPPYGALDKRSAHAVNGPSIIWDVDTGDWQSKDPKKIVKQVSAHTRPGSVALMHSIHPSTAQAAPAVFETVADKGLYAVTVRELFAGIAWEKGGSYFCRGYSDPLCSNPEHPSVQKN
ncbi:polysaccharide deacetylase family protein [Brevibacterium spongiae]|uniref:Polysaccharide deacetylase family protein n=1 Tax=Brevibacterium spongiae TaxID=2909672 RepID=A0ABY5SWR8_9MICO|nr:polysaccharide deacetylase family protein [Brevibacterium spongiae]UVI37593.1 polysaccharide deacetylase family protein [Brevibacterium spongiae]